MFQDADRLEALGAIGIARMFSVSGQLGGMLWDQDDPLAQHRERDDIEFALDHIDVKLLLVVQRMKTATGKKIARQRFAFIEHFREALLSEIDPPLA